MADVITRFRLETTQYDSKLRDAAKGLKEVVRVAELGGKDFKDFSQKSIEAARSLGQTASGATNAKDRLKDLVGSFNEAVKAYNRLSQAQQQSDFGKALSQSLEQLHQRIKQTKDELYGLDSQVKNLGSGGGMFGGNKLSGMLQVFGGNVMTKVAGAGIGLVGELKDAVSQGIELAKQGEGIRIAFERLGRGDILQGLREATHGTVTDMELMKAAVKFNDFKLPLDELGTMLAFAQQKAKDTGQSVDYMVDSIVTGLGRKSLMILDNLGLSAAEIRDKMKDTGDMTKAVGEIIREQMSKAGDYVETAADRALQANVSLQNKMEELGRKFAPVQEASNQLWTSIKIGILDIVGGPLARLLNGLTQAGQLRNAIADAGGSERVTNDINKLKGSNYKDKVYTAMLNRYSREEQVARNNWLKAQKGGMGSIQIWKNQYDAATALRQEFQSRGSAVVNPIKIEPPKTDTTTTTTTTTKNTENAVKELTEMQEKQQRINELTQEYVDISGNATDDVKVRQDAIRNEIAELQKAVDVMKLYQEQAHGKFLGGEVQTEGLKGAAFRGFAAADLKVEGLDIEKLPTTKLVKDGKSMADAWKEAAGAVQSVGDAFSQIKDPTVQASALVAKAIATIALGFAQATEQASATGIFGWIASLTAGAASMMTAIGAIHSATGYAQGGEIKGNTYSGDQIGGLVDNSQLVGLNAGEIVLNRAMAGNIASQLQGTQQRGGSSQPYVTGDMIFLGLTNYLKANGYGQLVTTNTR